MQAIEKAIMRTVLYGDIFHFAMTPAEIHHYLIHDTSTPYESIEHALKHSAFLSAHLIIEGDYVACHEHPHLISLRREREVIAGALCKKAIGWGHWLAALPFVRMVAVTGALAMRNPSNMHDDIDYLLVTTAGRVWLARAFAIAVVRLGALRGVTLCPNYVLAENTLEQSRRDLYIAHEVAQMLPLYGQSICETLREQNRWIGHHLPNATHPFYPTAHRPLGARKIVKTALEWVLGGRLGDWLEGWEQRRKMRRFQPDLTAPQSAARLDGTQVKGHFNDHGAVILRQYHERLIAYNLLETASAAAD